MDKLIISIFLIALWGCANRVPPTGGPKDEDPPELLVSTPANGTKNYKMNVIELYFNEFVTTKSIKEQLIITPRIESDYDYKIKKTGVLFEFEEPFNDSTTYTFNFREGIVDLTEGNSAKDLVVAFSTGPNLDTLEISGRVIDLMTGKPIDQAVIGIYEEQDTTDLFNNEPLYFTNSKEDGTYRFQNIKDGAYRIYAFIDANKNLICQSDREAYAFHTEVLKLDTNLVVSDLAVQHLHVDSLKVNRIQQSGHYVNLVASKYLTEATLTSTDTNTIRFKFDDEHESLRIYNTFEIKDSLLVEAKLSDSTGTVLTYPFYLKFEPTTSRRKDEFKANIKNIVASLEKKTINGTFTFDKPIERIDLDSVRIVRDSSMVIMLKETLQLVPDSTNTSYQFKLPIPKNMLDSIQLAMNPSASSSRAQSKNIRDKSSSRKTYKLIVPRGTYYSVEQDTSEEMSSDIKISTPKLLGIIQGSINTELESYELQLITEKFEVVQTAKSGSTYRFSEINPGEYLIRIMVDSNNNGRWDPGDIRLGQQPEPVMIYSDENDNQKTSIRANWEMTLNLTF